MPVELYNSLLILARTIRPYKARKYFLQLKEYRKHKRLKQELALKTKLKKASAEDADQMLVNEQHQSGECWYSSKR